MSMSREQVRVECRRLVDSGFDKWLTGALKESAIMYFMACDAIEKDELQIARIRHDVAERTETLIRDMAK